MLNPNRNPPFLLISSVCDPDSTKCSNILSVLPNSAPIGSTRVRSDRRSNPLMQHEEESAARFLCPRRDQPLCEIQRNWPSGRYKPLRPIREQGHRNEHIQLASNGRSLCRNYLQSQEQTK